MIAAVTERQRPMRDGRRRYWFDEEREPCGVAGALQPVSNLLFPHQRFADRDLTDCLASRPKPHILVIWEPLRTKAPKPPRAAPFCCYLRTVIFYHSPYILAVGKSRWRDSSGKWHSNRGGFEEWDKIEHRFGWDDVVEFEGENFVVGGGTVLWKRGRWWMLHSARRQSS